MNKISKNALQQSRPIFEELEERRLFSGGVEGLIDLDLDLDSEANAIYRDLDTGVTQTGQLGTGVTDAEGQSHEIAFVDAGVDNYQLLIDDLLSNADSNRNIEVVLLERDQNGIDRISAILQERDDLDAIHIISHGTDGSIELGASRLDAESLEENNLSIALWANAFAEFGDILVYGCNLAASEVGQNLIDELSGLTMADVAASDDLTGAHSLGGDWVLEASTGAIESTVAVSEQVQQSWEHVLTPAGYPDSNGQDNSFEWITNVSFAGINNTSAQEGGGYGDYSGQVGSIEQGEAALLSVTINADSQDYVNAWIDWDGDGDFTDGGEGYVLAANTGSNGPHAVMITAPNDAAIGTAILRVSLKYQGAAASDEVFQYGEVEDYSINVTASAVTALDNAYSVDEDTALNVDWWNTDWTQRQLLTFDNSGQTEDLTDFAVLVKLNSANIDYAQTQNGGQDLRFLDADGSALAYEIEQWNESGDSFVWVKVPLIDGASATDHIQMYYGNATAGDAQSPTEVWDGNYRGVWHLNESAVDEGSGAIHDDSAGDFDGTQDGNASAVGQIGGGQEFDGVDDFIDLGTDTIIDGRSAFTISAWVKLDASPGTNAQYGVFSRDGSPRDGTVALNVGQYTTDDTYYHVPTHDGTWNNHVADSQTGVGTWAHITAAYDGAGTIRYYLNGNPDGSDTYTEPSTVAGLSQRIGRHVNTSAGAFDGIIDEVRISATDRSADWIKAQHLSMTDAFVGFGGAQSAPAVGGVVATDLHDGSNTLTAILVSGPSQAAAFTFNADGTFSYTPNPGYHGSDSFTYKINDGTQDSNVATVTLTVDSIADAPVIGGVDSGSVTEDIAVVAGNLGASGGLTITDEDPGESSFQAETINGSYGDLVVDSAGNWSYSADNSQSAVQSLDAGESLVDTLTVTTFDGTSHDIVITINGAEDAAVIGGTATGAVAEDGTLTATDTLTITDADTSDNPVSFNDVAATLGDNGYGNFEITSNTWTYTLNNSHASVQALDAGETLNDTFTFAATDGSTQVVTVTINGAEDAAVIGGTAVGAVAED